MSGRAWVLALFASIFALVFSGAARADFYSAPSVPSYTDAQAANAAPVKSVNGNQGAVTVPSFFRQLSPATAPSSTTGVLTWTFPTPFTNMPTCFMELSAPVSNFAYDQPAIQSKSLTAISIIVTAHPSALSLLSTPLIVPAPSGTLVTLSCSAPQ